MSPVRVCSIADAECGQQCGNTPCKRELNPYNRAPVYPIKRFLTEDDVRRIVREELERAKP